MDHVGSLMEFAKDQQICQARKASRILQSAAHCTRDYVPPTVPEMEIYDKYLYHLTYSAC